MNRGYSLIEIVLVVTIMGILLSVILWPFANFRNEKLLDGAAEEIMAVLSEARNRTLSSDGATAYSVLFESDKITLMPDDKEIALSNHLEISNISLVGGGSTVTFKRLTGDTDQSGSVTVALDSDSSRTRVVTISSVGALGLN